MSRTTACSQCIWAEWTEKNGTRWQTGCRSGQFQKYQELKKKVDPSGHPIDNSVYKIIEGGTEKYYQINYPCVFQRSHSWGGQNADIVALPNEELREVLFSSIPFDYGLVVISDGNLKHITRTTKSVCNGTVKPRFVEIVNPPGLNSIPFIEKTCLEFIERVGKDIDMPDDYYDKNKGFWNFHQMADDAVATTRNMVYEAIKARQGYFWILVLTSGSKVDPQFIESIKRQTISELVDWHVISLDKEQSFLVGLVFLGTAELSDSACFIYKNDGTLVQEYKPDYVGEFFN